MFGNITTDARNPHTNLNTKALGIQRNAHRAETWAGKNQTDAFQQATAEWVKKLDPLRTYDPDFALCIVCHANPRDAGASVLEPNIGFSSSLTCNTTTWRTTLGRSVASTPSASSRTDPSIRCGSLRRFTRPGCCAPR